MVNVTFFLVEESACCACNTRHRKASGKRVITFFIIQKVQVRNTFPAHRREGYKISKEAYCLLAFTAVSLLAWVEEETEVPEAVSFTALAVPVVVDFTLPAVCWVLSTATAFVF